MSKAGDEVQAIADLVAALVKIEPDAPQARIDRTILSGLTTLVLERLDDILLELRKGRK